MSGPSLEPWLLLVAGALVALELWRRAAARSPAVPRWASWACWACFAAALLAGVTAWRERAGAAEAVIAGPAADKASALAGGLSASTNARAYAIACLAIAAGVLAWMTWRGRRAG